MHSYIETRCESSSSCFDMPLKAQQSGWRRRRCGLNMIEAGKQRNARTSTHKREQTPHSKITAIPGSDFRQKDVGAKVGLVWEVYPLRFTVPSPLEPWLGISTWVDLKTIVCIYTLFMLYGSEFGNARGCGVVPHTLGAQRLQHGQ